LATELLGFRSELPDLPLIKKCVSDTINLAESLPQLDTLDQLAQHCEDELSRPGSNEDLITKRVADAKIAICSMFVAREAKARKTGLRGYGRFIASIFGGDPWEEGVAAADCHVLSFNYDRLFEIAFLNHFRSFDVQKVSLYGNRALNSGFNPENSGFNRGFSSVDPASGRFNFLKLHGSAGWWVKKNQDDFKGRLYWPTVPMERMDLQDIENLLGERGSFLAWEPLITFPHEKRLATENDSTTYSHDPYIRRIWNQAAELIATATVVRVIGYSFSAVDSRHMVQRLLGRASRCQKIIIQNPDICGVKANLRSYNKQLSAQMEFDSSLFCKPTVLPLTGVLRSVPLVAAPR
jgi:hypothetical protein